MPIIERPTDLTEAEAAAWDKYVPLLAGEVGPSDAAELADLCRVLVRLDDLHKQLRDTEPGSDEYLRLLELASVATDAHIVLADKFAMNPQSRKRLAAVPPRPNLTARWSLVDQAEAEQKDLRRVRKFAAWLKRNPNARQLWNKWYRPE